MSRTLNWLIYVIFRKTITLCMFLFFLSKEMMKHRISVHDDQDPRFLMCVDLTKGLPNVKCSSAKQQNRT